MGICAVLLILYAIYCLHAAGAVGVSVMMSMIMGWMGCMSLIEAYKIYQLREKQLLHTHPLFHNARSWGAVRQDDRGAFYQINSTDLDDPETSGSSSCCLCYCCGPWSSDEDQEIEFAQVPPNWQCSEAQCAQRGNRERFLQGVEDRQAHNAKTVRQLEDERSRQ